MLLSLTNTRRAWEGKARRAPQLVMVTVEGPEALEIEELVWVTWAQTREGQGEGGRAGDDEW
ncbi:hypothetical protein HMPREF9153_1727 [Cutibacterium avidum ATCC 25577]|uniref:Uncharacterized protein n=1 Tax=Cutibacterium avidum ATCC 25577 TaxID=997355 RepID=G4CZ55_9ACTN|nr:hypothetical protein HMPREF9153_1727 [Cutibacterium avidum ATCC 25577]